MLLFVIIIGVSVSSKGKNPDVGVQTAKPLKTDITLLKTDNIGMAIEIQALLAREGIDTKRSEDGTKSAIVIEAKGHTTDDRDRALLAIVQSGLADQHVGLEIFDKGDFTSTKEDKKIRLVRAINGELARLIRKIDPIENAQVFVSIPEQTFFASRQKPITATVQVAVPSGTKLDNMKVRAITNLLLGAVQDLQAENVSITDTNGNVYSSIIDSANDALSKIEENDRYMQAKVSQQLDKLVGKGNYVVTVSTFLTQSPIEKTSIVYDPKSKTSVNEQGFSESLGDDSNDKNQAINAVSAYLPYGIPNNGSSSSQNRSYTRSATETQYGVSKTQINEYMKAGTIQEISIAVSLEQSSVPMSMTIPELKQLIANSASPLVKPENVSIAFIDSSDPLLAADRGNELPKPEESGNPWWIVGLVLLVGLGFGLRQIMIKVKKENQKHEEELESLRELSLKQQQQLQDMNLKAMELVSRQEQLAHDLMEQQNIQALQGANRKNIAYRPKEVKEDINDVLTELSIDFNDIDESAAINNLKKWIDE